MTTRFSSRVILTVHLDRHRCLPGETEEQYLATEALVRDCGFDRVNTAAYSPRPNTPAAEWDNQVADLIKQDRLNRCGARSVEHSGWKRC